VKVKGGLTL